MKLRQRVTWALMQALPPGERDRLVREFVDWLYADLAATERCAKAERIAPQLIEWIAQSKSGLWLLLYQHLSRLRPIKTFAHPGLTPQAETKRVDPQAAVK